MSKYYVPVVWSMMGHVEVIANSPNEAVKAAEKEILTCPLPQNGDYLEDSMEVDYESEPTTTPPLSWVAPDPIVLPVPTEAELFEDDEPEEAEDEPEFNAQQLDQIDAVQIAVYDLCRTMVGDELDWDMEYIGEIADMAAQILTQCGLQVYYPSLTEDADGRPCVEEYYTLDEAGTDRNNALANVPTDYLVAELTRRGWEPERMSVPLPFDRKLVVERGGDPEYPEFYTSVYDEYGTEMQLAVVGKKEPMSEASDDMTLHLLYWPHSDEEEPIEDADEQFVWTAKHIKRYLDAVNKDVVSPTCTTDI